MDEPVEDLELLEATFFCQRCRSYAPLWAYTDTGLCIMCVLPDRDETNDMPDDDGIEFFADEPQEVLSESVNWMKEGF